MSRAQWYLEKEIYKIGMINDGIKAKTKTMFLTDGSATCFQM